MGIIFAILNSFGMYPVLNERLNRWQRGIFIVGKTSFSNFVEIVSEPPLFFGFIFLQRP